jgi:hypothetical protein
MVHVFIPKHKLMKKLSTLLFLFIVANTLYSQTYYKRILWLQTDAKRLINTKDGGWIIIGVGNQNGFDEVTYSDFYAAKFNDKGKLQWTNRYGIDGRHDEGLSVIEDKANGYLFSGFSTDASGKRLGALMRVDSLGNKIWSKTFSGPTDFYLTSSVQTRDGGFIAGGNLTDGKHSRPVLIKLDAGGNVLKYIKINLSKNTIFRKIIMARNGDLVVLMDDGESDRNKKIEVMRITQSGSIKWVTRFGGIHSDYGYDMIETKDKGFAITGGNSFIDEHNGGTNYLATTSKLDSAGNVKWYNSTNADDVNSSGSSPIYGYSLLEDKDGSLISCGSVYRSKRPRSIYLLKYGADGNYLSSSYLPPLPSDWPGLSDYGHGIIKIRDGYVLAVSVNDAVQAGILKGDNNLSFCLAPIPLVPTFQSNVFVQDTVNVSLDKQTGISDTDNLNATTEGTDLLTVCKNSLAATAPIENKTKPLSIDVYPNPASNYITVTFNMAKTSRTMIQVYDITGVMRMQLLVFATAGRNIKQLNISSLQSGSYKIKVLQVEADAVQFFKQ